MSLVDVLGPLPNWLPGSGRAILCYDPQGKLLETIHPLVIHYRYPETGGTNFGASPSV